MVVEQTPIEAMEEPTEQEPTPTEEEPAQAVTPQVEDQVDEEAIVPPKTPRAKAKKATKPRVKRKVDVTVEEIKEGVEEVQQEEAELPPVNVQIARELLATHLTNQRAYSRQMRSSKYKSMMQCHI